MAVSYSLKACFMYLCVYLSLRTITLLKDKEFFNLCKLNYLTVRSKQTYFCHNMNIGNAYRQACNALCSYNCIILKLKKLSKKTKYKTQAIPLKFCFTVKILVLDSGTRFSQLVPANTNRSATLIENLTNCKQNVYFRFDLKACVVP